MQLFGVGRRTILSKITGLGWWMTHSIGIHLFSSARRRSSQSSHNCFLYLLVLCRYFKIFIFIYIYIYVKYIFFEDKISVKIQKMFNFLITLKCRVSQQRLFDIYFLLFDYPILSSLSDQIFFYIF